MTKPRAPHSRHCALIAAVAVIGWDGASRATGRRERLVRKWSEPDCGPDIPLGAALELDLAVIAAGGTVAPFEAWYRLHLQIARAGAENARHADMARRSATAAREIGEAIVALAHTLHHRPEVR